MDILSLLDLNIEMLCLLHLISSSLELIIKKIRVIRPLFHVENVCKNVNKMFKMGVGIFLSKLQRWLN